VSGTWGTSADPPEPPPPSDSPGPPPGAPAPPPSPPPSSAWQTGPPPGAVQQSGWQGAPPVSRPKTSGLAVASLVTGLFFWCFLIPGVVGIVLGFLSLEQIADSQGTVKGRGMALAGIILGYVGLGIAAAVLLAWVLSIVL
jgi:hypothetical protein